MKNEEEESPSLILLSAKNGGERGGEEGSLYREVCTLADVNIYMHVDVECARDCKKKKQYASGISNDKCACRFCIDEAVMRGISIEQNINKERKGDG